MSQLIIKIEAPEIAKAISLLATALGGKAVSIPQVMEKKTPVKELEQQKEANEDSADEKPAITLEQVRERTSKAVKKDREATKKLLSEFGASSVSTLDKKHYEAFYEKVGELV